jgi:hypothetical protein
LGYCSYVVTWAQRGRALTSELVGANRARISARESAAMVARAAKLLPAGHGQVTARVDSGFYSAELMGALRKQRVRFSMSAPRTSTMWRALGEIPEHAWADATRMRGAQVAEIAFTPTGFEHEPMRLIVRRVAVSAAELRAGNPRARRQTTIPAEQLQMVLDGQLESTWAYSFIVTDIPATDNDTVAVEHFHRQRAQIEERFKDAKLGQPLRHLPSGNLDANRLWLACCLLALNITAMVCDISPAAGACPDARRRAAAPPRQSPQAHPLRGPGPHHALGTPNDPASQRTLPLPRHLQRDLPRRARAARPLTTLRAATDHDPAAPPDSATPNTAPHATQPRRTHPPSRPTRPGAPSATQPATSPPPATSPHLQRGRTHRSSSESISSSCMST